MTSAQKGHGHAAESEVVGKSLGQEILESDNVDGAAQPCEAACDEHGQQGVDGNVHAGVTAGVGVHADRSAGKRRY